ncbi:MAG: heavy-metal-associated domain-containing protein [Sphaerobacter sp.]|nr:heavy-metal-associated domain-containing protein [Sphaerobacter sp.]
MAKRTYRVPDVSCEHCVAAITQELTKIPGVETVQVDLGSKLVTVEAADSVTDAQLRAGIEQAGYDIAGEPAASR